MESQEWLRYPFLLDDNWFSYIWYLGKSDFADLCQRDNERNCHKVTLKNDDVVLIVIQIKVSEVPF